MMGQGTLFLYINGSCPGKMNSSSRSRLQVRLWVVYYNASISRATRVHLTQPTDISCLYVIDLDAQAKENK